MQKVQKIPGEPLASISRLKNWRNWTLMAVKGGNSFRKKQNRVDTLQWGTKADWTERYQQVSSWISSYLGYSRKCNLLWGWVFPTLVHPTRKCSYRPIQPALAQLTPDPVKLTRKINITNYHGSRGICCFTWKITQVCTRSSNTILYNISLILPLESYQCVQMLQKPEILRELSNCFNLLVDILFTHYFKCTYFKLYIVLIHMRKRENIIYCRYTRVLYLNKIRKRKNTHRDNEVLRT